MPEQRTASGILMTALIWIKAQPADRAKWSRSQCLDRAPIPLSESDGALAQADPLASVTPEKSGHGGWRFAIES
jgi:hypothetical protein